MVDENPAWAVVRCSGSETLGLETEFHALGIKAWTPRVWARKRVPRKRSVRWIETAVLPSFVFVDLGYIIDHPTHVIGRFSYHPLVIRGELIAIPDAQLDGLREWDVRDPPIRSAVEPEVLEAPKMPEVILSVGDRVKVLTGTFDGYFGKVVKEPEASMVAIAVEGSGVTITVPSFLLILAPA